MSRIVSQKLRESSLGCKLRGSCLFQHSYLTKGYHSDKTKILSINNVQFLSFKLFFKKDLYFNRKDLSSSKFNKPTQIQEGR